MSRAMGKKWLITFVSKCRCVHDYKDIISMRLVVLLLFKHDKSTQFYSLKRNVCHRHISIRRQMRYFSKCRIVHGYKDIIILRIVVRLFFKYD
jgi:hypothetical protein